MQEELKLSGFPSVVCPSIDTVELARILLPTAESHKLGDLAKLFLRLNMKIRIALIVMRW
ncbi:hypothetical protein GCM10020331_067240 [Ectobacillus funiculus]